MTDHTPARAMEDVVALLLDTPCGADVARVFAAARNEIVRLRAALSAHEGAALPAEPVAWLVRHKANGWLELAKPHEKASNPERWTDAFPVYAAPVSAGAPTPVAAEPQPIDLCRELREALGMFAGSMPCTPKQAWDEAIAKARSLAAAPQPVADGAQQAEPTIGGTRPERSITLYNGSTSEPYIDIDGSDLWCDASDFTQEARGKIRWMVEAANAMRAAAPPPPPAAAPDFTCPVCHEDAREAEHVMCAGDKMVPAAALPEPFVWNDAMVLSVLRTVSDGSFRDEDITDMRACLLRADEIRADAAALPRANAPDREELLGDAIRALIRRDITCSDDLPPEQRPVHVSARRAFGAVFDLLAAAPPDLDANKLADAIVNAAVKAGIMSEPAGCAGPALLMLCDDLATAAAAAPPKADAPVDAVGRLDLLELKPEPDRYVDCGESRPLPMFHLATLLQFGNKVAALAASSVAQVENAVREAPQGGKGDATC